MASQHELYNPELLPLNPHHARLHFVANQPIAVEVFLPAAKGWTFWVEHDASWRLLPQEDFMLGGCLHSSDWLDLDRLRSLYDFEKLAEAYVLLLGLELVPVCRREVGGNA